MQSKYVYKGEFNWNGELLKFFTSTSTIDKAFSNCIFRLSKKVGYSRNFLRNHFLSKEERYSLHLIKEV